MLDLQRLLKLAGLNESYQQLDEAREDDAAKVSGLVDVYNADTSVPNKPEFTDPLELAKHFSTLLGMPAAKYLVRFARWYGGHNFTLADFADVKAKLEEFDKDTVKRALVAAGHPNDINNYPSYHEFTSALDPILQQGVQSGKEQKAEKKAEVKKLMDYADFKVYLPQSEAASQFYGSGTSWCTAYTKAEMPCQFNKYHAQGELYIIWARDDSGSPKAKNGGRKYQIHMENNEFKNSLNNDVDKEDIHWLSQLPHYKELLEYLINKYYH